MGFFSSDLGLAEQFANPKVSRIYQPSAGNQPLSSSVFSDNPFEALTQAISGGTGGTSGGFNMPWSPDLGDGTQPPGYSPTPTPTPAPTTPEVPASGSDSFSTSGPLNIYGSDYASAYYTDPMGNPLSELDQYILDMQNTPDWQLGLANMIPGFGMLNTAKQLSMGINPFYNSFTRDYLGASPTLDSYTGSTDAFGNPITSGQAAYADQMGGYADTFEQMAAEEYGWGSDEHFAAIEETFDDLPTATEEPGLLGGLFDFELPDLTLTAPSEPDPQAGTTFYGSDYNWNDGGGDSPGGFDGGADSASSIGASDYDADNYSDWSADEFSDDFGFGDEGDSGGDDGDGGGDGSYIATAATQALGKDGLKVFEDWRDYMFTVLPTFTSSFGRYRATAPKIVAEIDKKENSKNIYSWIWDMHLKPIFDLIREDKDSDRALKDYKVMVRELSNKFLKKEKV